MSATKKIQGNHRTGLYGKAAGAGFLKQIDPDTGKVVATYWGYHEMERLTGIPRPTIRYAACHGTKSHGYFWEYERKKDVSTGKNI